MHVFTDICQALSDATRVRAVMALRGRELCACQLIELLGLAPSTISKHMMLLRQAGLVESRKCGRWMYYRLTEERGPRAVQELLAWMKTNLAKDAQIKTDASRLKEILKMSPEELCGREGK